jgi:predicted peptidase
VTTTNLNPSNHNILFEGLRKVTNVYVNDTPAIAEGRGVGEGSGRYIIIELEHGFNLPGASTQAWVGGIMHPNATGGRNVNSIMNYVITQVIPYSLEDDVTVHITQKYIKTGEINLIVDDFAYGINKGVPYRLYTPEDVTEPVPLVLWMHGSGEATNVLSGLNNEAQIRANMGGTGWVEAQYRGDIPAAYVMAAQSTRTGGPGDNGWSDEEFVAIIEVISELIEDGKVDKDRIYISGCSLGGRGTLRMIMSYPDFFAAAIPMCGAEPQFYTDEQLLAIKDLPVWIVWSELDGTIESGVHFNCTTTYERMAELGANVRKSVYGDVVGINGETVYSAHWIWVTVLNNTHDETHDIDFMGWLFEQSR